MRAADEGKNELRVDVKKLGTIPFEKDNETLQDTMAFTGPAPEVGASPVSSKGVHCSTHFCTVHAPRVS